MARSVTTAEDRPVRRGGLDARLLDLAVQMVAEQGHQAMSLREVQRRAGVSAAAAYRHYSDREALLLAVGRRASGLLADHLQAALTESEHEVEPDAGEPVRLHADAAAARLRRGCEAYLDFACREPNLFRAVFLTAERPEQLEHPEQASVGASGRGPYQILQDCLADMVAPTGETSPDDLSLDATAVWSATHGLAILLLDGPLRFLDTVQRKTGIDRLLDIVLAGLATRTAQS